MSTPRTDHALDLHEGGGTSTPHGEFRPPAPADRARTRYETSRLKDAFDVIDEALLDMDTNHGACLCTDDGDTCENHEKLRELEEVLKP